MFNKRSQMYVLPPTFFRIEYTRERDVEKNVAYRPKWKIIQIYTIYIRICAPDSLNATIYQSAGDYGSERNFILSNRETKKNEKARDTKTCFKEFRFYLDRVAKKIETSLQLQAIGPYILIRMKSNTYPMKKKRYWLFCMHMLRKNCLVDTASNGLKRESETFFYLQRFLPEKYFAKFVFI